MDTAGAEGARGAGRPSRARMLAALCVVVVALVPRLVGLDNAVTVDEPLWLERSDGFYSGLRTGHLSRTYGSPHPGVTTMWLAGAGLRLVPQGDGPADPYRRARVPFAVATALAIGGVWVLARRLFGAAAATAAGLALALDPFLLHHSRVVHTDALVTLAMLLAALAFLDALRRGRGFATAGVFTGLALLTKGTALFLFPFLGWLLAVREAGSMRAALSRETLGRLWRHAGLRRALAATAATFVVLWPAVWVRPWDALAAPFLGAGRGAVIAQERNFFLGATPRDPGPAFYPVAIAYRTTTAALAVTAVAAVSLARRRREAAPRPGPAVRDLRALLAFAALFVALITPGAKKLDRFALPAIVAFETAAAAWLGLRLSRATARGRAALAWGAAAALLAVHAAPGLATAPDYLGAFNPLLGGGPAARHVILAGGGEGLDRAGEILERLGARTVATTRRTGLQEAFSGRLIGIDEGPADHVLFYVSSVQTGVAPAIWDAYRRLPPVATVRIGGITKVWIWPATLPPHV